jgi:hypothetical protein
MTDTKAQLIELRSDPEYQKIKPIIRKAIDKIEKLEQRLKEVQVLCKHLDRAARGE